MASVSEYLEQFSTSQLQALLREECAGQRNLPLDVILQICQILSRRDATLPPIGEAIRELCRKYQGA